MLFKWKGSALYYSNFPAVSVMRLHFDEGNMISVCKVKSGIYLLFQHPSRWKAGTQSSSFSVLQGAISDCVSFGWSACAHKPWLERRACLYFHVCVHSCMCVCVCVCVCVCEAYSPSDCSQCYSSSMVAASLVLCNVCVCMPVCMCVFKIDYTPLLCSHFHTLYQSELAWQGTAHSQ